MRSILLIVKASEDVAAKCATERGLAVIKTAPASHSSIVPYATVLVEVLDGETKSVFDKVMSWFCAPGEAPYPDGTLLYYTHVQESGSESVQPVASQ